MIYDIGDKVLLSTTVEDDTGTAVNTPTLVIAVTKPDGTTVSPAPTVTNSGSGGIYTAAVTVDAAGTWTYAWTASGTVTAVEPGQFTVCSATVYVASLEELKHQLRRTDSADDLELRGHLASATRYVEKRLGGPVSVQTFTERHLVTGPSIVPRRRPLVSVTSITPDLGSALTSDAYVVDTDLNQIILRYGAIAWYTLVYTAGLAQVSENAKLAGLIIAQHLWETQNGGGGRRTQDTVPSGLGFAIPRRAAEMLDVDEMSGIS